MMNNKTTTSNKNKNETDFLTKSTVKLKLKNLIIRNIEHWTTQKLREQQKIKSEKK